MNSFIVLDHGRYHSAFSQGQLPTPRSSQAMLLWVPTPKEASMSATRSWAFFTVAATLWNQLPVELCLPLFLKNLFYREAIQCHPVWFLSLVYCSIFGIVPLVASDVIRQLVLFHCYCFIILL